MRKIAGVSLFVAAVGLMGSGCRTAGTDVRQYGEVRAVLRDGRTEARIGLAEATKLAHAYGVGALAELGGEITILDGDVWVARASGTDLTVTGPEVVATDRATLLTLSVVREWESIGLTETVGGKRLETTVERLASERGIDTTKPFPFVINGKIIRLESHVIAGSCPASGIKGGADPWRTSIDQPVEATLVGFFAKGKDGIMTHHGSSVHVHIVMRRAGRTITAHVDDVLVGDGSVLRLPK
jgi:hypothetical protein